jgi:hypothetical protein
LNIPSIRRQELIKEERQYKRGASGKAIFGIIFGIVFVALTAFVAVEKTLPSNTNSNDNIGLIELNPAKEAIKATSSPTTAADIGDVNGLVTGQNGLPVKGASIIAYKQMGLIDSVEKTGGYSIKFLTHSSGHYSFELPSGVYKFTVTYPDGKIQMLPNYAVWPSSISEHSFQYSTDYTNE